MISESKKVSKTKPTKRILTAEGWKRRHLATRKLESKKGSSGIKETEVEKKPD